MYARSKTFVANVRMNTTFVVATSQSQSVAFIPRGSAAVTYASTIMVESPEWLSEEILSCYYGYASSRAAALKLLLCSERAATNFYCAVYAITQHLSFVVGLSYNN